MRLWHYKLIPVLPRQQLLGQHRECCALRGKGWGRKHATVNYVFEHPYYYLFWYHLEVMKEMRRRGYNVDENWMDRTYRGKLIGDDFSIFTDFVPNFQNYPEHNEAYLQECIDNLAEKGITICL